MRLFWLLLILTVVELLQSNDDCEKHLDLTAERIKCWDLPEFNNSLLQSEICRNELNETIKGFFNYSFEIVVCKLSECILNKLNVIQDSKINSAKYKESISRYLIEKPGWEKITNIAVDKCSSESEDKTKELKTKFGEKHNSTECEPKFLFFSSCLFTQMLINCPPEYYKPDDDCDVYKSYITKCPDLYSNIF